MLLKRWFDLLFASIGLTLFWWLILISYVLASLDTRSNGFFLQDRVGMHGRIFRIIKIRTMRVDPQVNTTVTTNNDPRITRFGRLLRNSKIDELPQLINIILGHMSFVGPRPDVPGFADRLDEVQKVILSVRPGITGPATLKYRNEETILSRHQDPSRYNEDYIWPDKVKINIEYIENWSFFMDLHYLWRTLFK